MFSSGCKIFLLVIVYYVSNPQWIFLANAKTKYTGSIFSAVNVNQAYISQSDGVFNRAYQVQHFSGDHADAGPNEAVLIQEGSGNYYQQVQIGGDCNSLVTQLGDGNVAGVYQNVHDVAVPDFIDLPIPLGN